MVVVESQRPRGIRKQSSVSREDWGKALAFLLCGCLFDLATNTRDRLSPQLQRVPSDQTVTHPAEVTRQTSSNEGRKEPSSRGLISRHGPIICLQIVYR